MRLTRFRAYKRNLFNRSETVLAEICASVAIARSAAIWLRVVFLFLFAPRDAYRSSSGVQFFHDYRHAFAYISTQQLLSWREDTFRCSHCLGYSGDTLTCSKPIYCLFTIAGALKWSLATFYIQ